MCGNSCTYIFVATMADLNLFFQTPGNHEFDDGIEGFLPFLKNISFPMICCNLDDSELPDNKKLSPFIEKSKVVEVNGRKIGLIGYVTTDTPVSIYST